MKFVYEMYENGNRGLIFKGYKTIVSDNSDNAEVMALTGLDKNVQLYRIYFPQEE